jgi:hypothetical protein
MKSVRTIAFAVALAGASAMAHAESGGFACISGSFSDCSLATSTVSWAWDGLDFTVANSGDGYVSEVYFDLGAGMSASFLSGTGGNVFFYAGANPGSLPDGGSVGFVSDASFDSDPAGRTRNGIDLGETATFRITGAALDSFDADTLVAGLHVRSLVDSSASLVTTTVTTPIPEPSTYGLLLAGLGVVGFVTHRRSKTA